MEAQGKLTAETGSLQRSGMLVALRGDRDKGGSQRRQSEHDSSLESFFAESYDRLVRALLPAIGDIGSAEEAAQEAMTRVFARWNRQPDWKPAVQQPERAGSGRHFRHVSEVTDEE